MSNPPTSPISVDPALADFDRTLNRWGPATMLVGLLFSVAGPLYLMYFTDAQVAWPEVWKAWLAIAATFGVIWITEPLTYYPMLGAPSMYQAFMIGNIANKLLPAAVAAQDRLDAQPGTKKAQIAAIVAICGAAAVHLMSLLIFVGFMGTWLISVIPMDVLDTTRLYILPVVMGAVTAQTVMTSKHRSTAMVGVVVSALVVLLIMPPLIGMVSWLAMVVTPFAVILSAVVAWVTRPRN